tara:strand:+ start:172 stop:513 length:342 start_codon:yes stop_codon:yes gene_type:complete
MRQVEIFPYLADQELIDNYLRIQHNLEFFKKSKARIIVRIRLYKDHLKFYKSLLNEPEKHSIFLVKKEIKELKEEIELNKDTLIEVEEMIDRLNNILKKTRFGLKIKLKNNEF